MAVTNHTLLYCTKVYSTKLYSTIQYCKHLKIQRLNTVCCAKLVFFARSKIYPDLRQNSSFSTRESYNNKDSFEVLYWPSFMTNGKISQDNSMVGDNPGDKVFNRSSSVSSCSGSQNCTLLLLFEASWNKNL